LRAYLQERLPGYMVPSVFVTLSEVPLTAHGKVDRGALHHPEEGVVGTGDYVSPRTATEEIVAGLWASVLKMERVGVTANFFEIGGHSLLATQVMSRVRETFAVELPLRELFEQRTVAGLAQRLDEVLQTGAGVLAPPIVAVAREQSLPLSFAQQRLWFLDQLEPASAFYNIPAALRLEGKLNSEALLHSLEEIVRRHEALRTIFPNRDGEPVQVISEAETLEIDRIDLSGLAADERKAKARELATAEAQTPFDLNRGPLLRVKLLRLGRTGGVATEGHPYNEEEHVLLVTMHHIISDGWSMGVLIRELTLLYEAYSRGAKSPLEELPIQYADYAVWQRNWLQGAVLEAQMNYWRAQLAGAPAVLALPTDRIRPAVQNYRGAAQSKLLPLALSKRLKELSERQGVTLFMTLLAAFEVLLYRYSGQDDFCVGSPIANRKRPEVEGLNGFYVNTHLMRAEMSGNPSYL
jgi:acyl carrier protein